MTTLHFKDSAAAEMLMHTNQGARMALRIKGIRDGVVDVQLVVTLNGEEMMLGDDTMSLYAGDAIVMPHDISVKFSVA